MRSAIILGIFLHVVVSGLFVQLFLLPGVIPSLHGEHGLLKGSDAEGFHRLAVVQAGAIRAGGWSEWVLRPGGQSPAGIASALYVLAGMDRPWVLLPLHGVLWAFSGWLLFHIMRPMTSSDGRALVGALVFILPPSSLLFLSQLHKDPFVISGWLVQWLMMARVMRERAFSPVFSRRLATRVAGIAGGMFLMWVGRPYLVFLVILGLCCVCVWLLLIDGWRRKVSWAAWIFIVVWLGMSAGLSFSRDTQEYTVAGTAQRWPELQLDFRGAGLGPLDAAFRRMAIMRHQYLHSFPEARSRIDPETSLDSSWKVMAYVPRAIQVLFFSPFPSEWGRGACGGALGWLLSLETLGRYLLFPGLAWLTWRHRRSFAFFAPWLLTVPAGLVMSIITPNLGTLVRVRFSLVMTLAALGAIGTFMLLDEWRKGKARG